MKTGEETAGGSDIKDRKTGLVAFCGLWIVIALADLLWIKRYFSPPAEQQRASPQTPV